MAKYATSVYPKSGMTMGDGAAMTLNIVMLAVIYTTLGGIFSFAFYYLFDEYDIYAGTGLEWAEKSLAYQLTDLVLEIGLVASFSFWITFFVNENFPIIPVKAWLASYIDTYSTGLFFMYTIFIFVDSFGYKLQHIINRVFGPVFDKYMPDSGSIVDFSLHWNAEHRKKQEYSKQANTQDAKADIGAKNDGRPPRSW